MSDRCEPPEHLRWVDGWHWLNDCPVRWRADQQEWEWNEDEWVPPKVAYYAGYRYIAPVSTPAEVDALRDGNTRLRATLRRIRDAQLGPDKGSAQWCADLCASLAREALVIKP